MRISFQLQPLLALGVASDTALFDYVIVGGGTAGLVVANRLSENPKIQVAVIEPGDDVRAYPGVMNFETTVFNTSWDYQFESTPQPELDDRQVLYHAGKAIGGTSNMNGMIYTRGEKSQINAWETLGNENWNWDTLFSFGKLSENFTVPTAAQISQGASYIADYHGEDGYLKTGFPYEMIDASFPIMLNESTQKIGLPYNRDINDGSLRGFGAFPRTIDRDADVRETATRAYYEPVESRTNLKIIQGTVRKITWSNKKGQLKTATGVQYLDAEGKLTVLAAAKEVILATGAYKTPLLLELSGVGNPKILAKNNITTKINLPGVGEGLQDANYIPMSYSLNTNSTGLTPFAVFATIEDLFGAEETAILAKSSAASLSSWAKAVSSSLNNAISPSSLEKRFKIQHDVMFRENSTVGEILWVASDSMLIVDLMPFSWGNVHLGSASEINVPVLDPKIHAIEFDTDILMATGRLTQKVFRTRPFSDIVLAAVSPDAEAVPVTATDDQWISYIKNSTDTAWHGLGTCAMVPKELGGVVDSSLKVYGTSNVRIVDASVIPTQISGHLMAVLYAVAERASDIIKESQ
ncbi:unnamed protein product [Discula destructiva]